METERVAETMCSLVFFRIPDDGQSKKTVILTILQIREYSFPPKKAPHPLETIDTLKIWQQ
jgi:hypothetical protein